MLLTSAQNALAVNNLFADITGFGFLKDLISESVRTQNYFFRLEQRGKKKKNQSFYQVLNATLQM